jgi:protein involved in polysaccharide export with SLBB domain
MSRSGTFEFLEGMRVSDLLFRAGVPLQKADRYSAELSRAQEGKPSQVQRLDLSRLLSSESQSPVDLKDDALNPLLHPFDQLSIYAKPDFRAHRTVMLSGQVVRPGIYELDSPKTTLREILERAGGFTPEAMPNAGVFLRAMGTVDKDQQLKALKQGIESTDPTNLGANDVLKRLNETKRSSMTGALLANPLLHGLAEGNLNRLVVNFPKMLEGDPGSQVVMQDGDEVVIPRKTEVAYVVGETASPFAAYKVLPGMTVKDILSLAGGPTRNADTWNIRLMKADGRILDRWVSSKAVEPGDALLVPQRIRRDSSWQENLAALTPLAILVNTFK